MSLVPNYFKGNFRANTPPKISDVGAEGDSRIVPDVKPETGLPLGLDVKPEINSEVKSEVVPATKPVAKPEIGAKPAQVSAHALIPGTEHEAGPKFGPKFAPRFGIKPASDTSGELLRAIGSRRDNESGGAVEELSDDWAEPVIALLKSPENNLEHPLEENFVKNSEKPGENFIEKTAAKTDDKIDDFGHQSDAKLAPAPALSANPAPVTDFDDATVRSPEKNTLEKNNPEKTNPEKIMRLLHLDCEEFFRRGFSQGLSTRLLLHPKSGRANPLIPAIKPDITSVENVGEADKFLETTADFGLMVVEPRPFTEHIFHRLREWRLRYPDMKLVVLSNILDRAIIMTAIDAGIHGYIPKNFTGEEICAALELVVHDTIFLPKFIADVGRKKVLTYPEFAKIRPQTETKKSLENHSEKSIKSEKMSKNNSPQVDESEENIAELSEPLPSAAHLRPESVPESVPESPAKSPAPDISAMAAQLPDHYAEQLHGFTQLTSKQRDILLRLISGRSAGEIAQELNMADATIQVHISAIMRFLGARQDYRHQQQGQQVGQPLGQQAAAPFRPENIKRA